MTDRAKCGAICKNVYIGIWSGNRSSLTWQERMKARGELGVISYPFSISIVLLLYNAIPLASCFIFNVFQ